MKTARVYSTIVCLAFLVTVAHPLEAQRARWADAIEEFSFSISQDVADDAVGGIAAGIMVNGDLVWADAWGLANRDTREPMGSASVSRTGSISKSVTALLMMVLVDRGVIRLDDPVSRYLPEINDLQDRRPGSEDITFRHLASHTAGLIREPDWSESVVGPISDWESSPSR